MNLNITTMMEQLKSGGKWAGGVSLGVDASVPENTECIYNYPANPPYSVAAEIKVTLLPQYIVVQSEKWKVLYQGTGNKAFCCNKGGAADWGGLTAYVAAKRYYDGASFSDCEMTLQQSSCGGTC